MSPIDKPHSVCLRGVIHIQSWTGSKRYQLLTYYNYVNIPMTFLLVYVSTKSFFRLRSFCFLPHESQVARNHLTKIWSQKLIQIYEWAVYFCLVKQQALGIHVLTGKGESIQSSNNICWAQHARRLYMKGALHYFNGYSENSSPFLLKINLQL